jgi:hypothetical protein
VLLLSCTPLVWVHARIAYLDLPVGLLAAALYVELASQAPSPLRALLIAGMLTGAKDEGFAYVGVVVMISSLRRSQRAHAAALLSGGLVFVTWRYLCWRHHVSDPDHTIGVPDFSQLPALLAMTGRHLCDLRSFGGLWFAIAGALVHAITARKIDDELRCLLVGFAVVVLGSVLLGPPQVREFARNGTLIGRLLLQLVPLACVAIAAALSRSTMPRPSS